MREIAILNGSVEFFFMKIDEKIIAGTLGCQKNFDCLNSNQHVYCKVEDCINKEVYFIQYREKPSCNYKMSFGNTFICNCPTRKEIFNKYGQ